jgi:hypothetical protein
MLGECTSGPSLPAPLKQEQYVTVSQSALANCRVPLLGALADQDVRLFIIHNLIPFALLSVGGLVPHPHPCFRPQCVGQAHQLDQNDKREVVPEMVAER